MIKLSCARVCLRLQGAVHRFDWQQQMWHARPTREPTIRSEIALQTSFIYIDADSQLLIVRAARS